MTEDKSQPIAEQWQLMRSLYETAGLSLKEISLLTQIPFDEISRCCQIEDWRAVSKSEKTKRTLAKSQQNIEGDLRLENARTAKQVSAFLKRMLRAETKRIKDEEKLIDTQSSTKNVLAIAKGVLTIEEMIANLEKLTDASSLYPQDALEFHSRLEKQISNIANAGT